MCDTRECLWCEGYESIPSNPEEVLCDKHLSEYYQRFRRDER